jgi:hypothetical protein
MDHLERRMIEGWRAQIDRWLLDAHYPQGG